MGFSKLQEVSVIVVSDYNGVHSNHKSWADQRHILTTLANQDFKEPFDVVLVENDAFRDAVPSDLKTIIPNLKIFFSPCTRSAELKDYGVSLTSSPFVAVLEADCVLNVEWLRVLVEVLRQYPYVAAVSGKTIYGTSNLWQRSFSLLDRAYMDLGHLGLTKNLSNNSALYRRELLEQYPYPQAGSPFVSASLRLKDIGRNGHVLFFEPRAVVIHAFGWKLEQDLRRNIGFLHMTMVAKKQLSIIPKILMKNLWREACHCKRIGGKYLRWFDWPVALVLLVLVRFLEIPGMIHALRKKETVPGTSYR